VTYLGDTGDVSAEFHARDDVDALTFRTSGRHVRFVAWTGFYAQHDRYRAG
jgi:hypothetical protein